MNEVDQRIAIAEACGWTGINYGRASKGFETYLQACEWVGFEPDWGANPPLKPLPRYLQSLDAMHKAEEVLTKPEWPIYEKWLQASAWAKATRYNSWQGSAIHATAPQRAEAFLRARNLWVE